MSPSFGRSHSCRRPTLIRQLLLRELRRPACGDCHDSRGISPFRFLIFPNSFRDRPKPPLRRGSSIRQLRSARERPLLRRVEGEIVAPSFSSRRLSGPSSKGPQRQCSIDIQSVTHRVFQIDRATFAPCLVKRVIAQRPARCRSHALVLAFGRNTVRPALGTFSATGRQWFRIGHRRRLWLLRGRC